MVIKDRRIKFGVSLPLFAGAGDAHPRTPMLEQMDARRLAEFVKQVEAFRYDSLWIADHLILGKDSAILECWSVASWAAGLTSKVRLGLIHLSNLFRSPALTAKMAASLDVLSGGRLDFFYDMGHRGSREETEAYGFLFPEDDERMARFEEALELMKLLWTGEPVSFEGRFLKLKDAVCRPKPVQTPYPPIWIGTLGGETMSASVAPNEQVIDLVVKHADGWNNTPASPKYCANMLSLLKESCNKHGRDYNDIKKSLETQVLVAQSKPDLERIQRRISEANPRTYPLSEWEHKSDTYMIGTPQEIIDRLDQYVQLGIDGFQLWFMDAFSLDGMRLFSEQVAPAFR